jgi:phosphoglycolate phosphatase
MGGSRFKAVMFDLDGTLLDTLEDIANTTNKVLGELGLPEHPLDAYKSFIGNGAGILLKRALPEIMRSEDVIEDCLVRFKRIYQDHCVDTAKPYPGIPEVLNYLVGNQIPFSCFSNKPDEFTQRCVKELMAQWSFAAIAGQKEGSPKKPDPSVALAICGALGVTPAETMYVGDSDVDMQTANAAGMFAVGAAWGFRPKEELLSNGADAIAEEPLNLIDFLQ